MAAKQLVVVVEGTSAMGPQWNTVLSQYLDKIIRCFCHNDLAGQKLSTASIELSLVVFNVHGSRACLVHQSGWTRDVDVFLQWLSAIHFIGGGLTSEAAIAEGLSEALLMLSQNADVHKHCILVGASDPYPLPTPVYRPQISNVDHDENIKLPIKNCLADAETVAKTFAQCYISLSVISPRQLPKLRAIYNAGKHSSRAADPSVNSVNNPQFLVLLSENFMEEIAALSCPGVTNITSKESQPKMDATLVPSVNGAMINHQFVPAGNIPSATLDVEPNTMPSRVSGSSFPHPSSVTKVASQSIRTLQTSPLSSNSEDTTSSSDSMQGVEPMTNGILQHFQPSAAAANVSFLMDLSKFSQARQMMSPASLTESNYIGLQTMGGDPTSMHMSNMIPSGMTSSVLPAAQSVFSSGQSVITPMAGSGSLFRTAQVSKNAALASFASATYNLYGNLNHGMSEPLANIHGAASLGHSVPEMNQGNLSRQIEQDEAWMNRLATSTLSEMPTPELFQKGEIGMQPLSVTNRSTKNTSLPQQTSGATQTGVPDNYMPFWKGALYGTRQGEPMFITKLIGYKCASASETFAADWEPNMQVERLMSIAYIDDRQPAGKGNFLVFQALNQNIFLEQLNEKKLLAVIKLRSQTLLLSVSDKRHLIGLLFPGVFIPQQIPRELQRQQQMQRQQQLQRLQQHYHEQHLQNQQLLQQERFQQQLIQNQQLLLQLIQNQQLLLQQHYEEQLIQNQPLLLQQQHYEEQHLENQQQQLLLQQQHYEEQHLENQQQQLLLQQQHYEEQHLKNQQQQLLLQQQHYEEQHLHNQQHYEEQHLRSQQQQRQLSQQQHPQTQQQPQQQQQPWLLFDPVLDISQLTIHWAPDN